MTNIHNEEPAAQAIAEAEKSGPPSSDGGLIGWLQVVGVFGVWANTWGIVNAFGEFQTYYETILTQSPSQIAWVGSIQAFLLLFVGVFSGPLMDRGYFRLLLCAGNFMVVFGMMMASICKEYWQILLSQGFLVGIGMGTTFIPGVSILPQYFVKRRQWAIGIAAVGSGLGGAIYPIIFHRLIPSIDFGWTVRVLAFVSLFFTIIAATTLRNKLAPNKSRKLFSSAFFRDKSQVLYAAGLFVILISLYIPAVYISSYSLQYHITDSNLAFYLVPILQGSNIVGRLVLTFFADWTGPINMSIPGICILSILAFVWISVRNTAGLIIFAVFYGTFLGAIQALGPACVVSLTKPEDSLATVTGTAFGISSFGVLIGTPIAGVILRSANGFIGLQIFTGVVAAVATVLYIACRVTKVGIGLVKI